MDPAKAASERRTPKTAEVYAIELLFDHRSSCVVPGDVEVMDPNHPKMANLLGALRRDRCERPPPTVRELAELVGLAAGTVQPT
jgi:hypothetical protein